MTITSWEIALRLGLAVLFGGLVGFERERHNRPAGFRTHILVCTGATLMMMVSAYGFLDHTGFDLDPGRIAAQVVTGVGFLGAGTIMRHRGSIFGLTTAASIWVVSGIGLAVGIGFYWGAALATMVVLISLLALGRLDQAVLSNRRLKSLTIKALDRPGLLSRVTGVLGDLGINIQKIDLKTAGFDDALQSEVIAIDLRVIVPAHLVYNHLFRRLTCLKGVLEITWQGEEVSMGKDAEDIL